MRHVVFVHARWWRVEDGCDVDLEVGARGTAFALQSREIGLPEELRRRR